MTYKITIEGTVQGVGFRPFVYQIATNLNFFGTVSNGTQGVEIIVTTNPENLKVFIQEIQDKLPLLASIESITVVQIKPGNTRWWEWSY